MIRADSPQPPRLATWLLEQFSPVLKNAPLAGDLIEAFKRGRSSGWYWRQVLWAILIALRCLLWKQWGRLAYAVLCSYLIGKAWFFMFPIGRRLSGLPLLFAVYAKGYRIQWPWSLVYQMAFQTVFQGVIVAFALGAYLGFSRIWKPHSLRALMVVVVVLLSGNVALPFLTVALISMQLRLSVGWWVLVSTPAIALLFGIWQANRGDDTSRYSKSLPRS